MIASTLAASRPSLKFGTHSTMVCMTFRSARHMVAGRGHKGEETPSHMPSIVHCSQLRTLLLPTAICGLLERLLRPPWVHFLIHCLLRSGQEAPARARYAPQDASRSNKTDREKPRFSAIICVFLAENGRIWFDSAQKEASRTSSFSSKPSRRVGSTVSKSFRLSKPFARSSPQTGRQGLQNQ